MSSTPQFNGEQLAAARKERWHQGGDALLTLEAAREWVSELGLVLFAPRAQQLPAPAPSLVEATLGRAASAPTAAETETARGLVARMVAEGAALPLNLLGGPGDVPDFVVSAQVFSYVFTLRGDKAWKQPPVTSGSLKVSLLAAKVYETLAQGDALTAVELASELGREVTEAAIVRALVELWAQLRVIPVLQQDGAGAKGSGTMWELTSRRFTKQMKAGANAGQPTALSALVSAYLAQAYAATEEEAETFLSPLSARSKVRDVLHGLSAARQTESVVLEGKTLFYVPGALPEFPEIAVAEPEKTEGTAQAAAPKSEEPRERIRRFDRPRPAREERGERTFRGERERPTRTDRERPAKPFGEKRSGGARPGGKSFGERGRPAKPFGEKRSGGARPAGKSFGDRERRPAKPFGEKRSGGARPAGKSFGDRERRPFQRDRPSGERPSFARPWDEERKPRPKREEGERPARERTFRKDDARGAGAKREFRGGARTPGSDRGERQERPFRARREGSGEGFAPRSPRPFRERSEPGSDERKRRPSAPRPGGKPGFAGKPKFGEKRAFGDKPKFGDKKKFGDKPKFGEKRAFGDKPKFGEKRPFGDKPKFGEKKKFGDKPKFGEKRAFGDKPKFGEKKKFGGKPGFGGKPKFGGRSKFGGPAKFAGKPKFGGKPGAKRAPRSGEDKPRREAEE